MSTWLVLVLKNSCITDKSAFVQKQGRPPDLFSQDRWWQGLGLIIVFETSCNIAMLCSRTSASFLLRRTRFGQVHWIFLFPGQEERGPNRCWIWDPSFHKKQVQGVQRSSLLTYQHCTYPLVYTTIYFNNLIVLFTRPSKLYLIYCALPM